MPIDATDRDIIIGELKSSKSSPCHDPIVVAMTSPERQERPEQGTTYIAYPRRWFILLTVSLLNVSNAALWINISPVPYLTAEYFNRELWEVNMFSLVFLFVSIPFCFISTISVNNLGLKTAIQAGSALNCVGGILRALGTTSAIIPDKTTQFAISLTGQTIAGMAQSFLLFIPTKVSQQWFPEDARSISTTIISLSNPMGIVVAMVSTPLIVVSAKDFPTLNYVFGGVALVTEVITIFCVTRSKPPTPPSQSAEVGDIVRAPYLQQLKSTFTSPPYLLILVVLGSGVALFSSLATVTQQLLCPLGYSEEFGGMTVAVMIICGFFGSAFTGVLAGKTKAFIPIVKIFYGGAALCIIFMFEMFLLPHQGALVATAAGLFGFFGVGVYPIGLELGVEATYPVEETISTAFIFMSGQVQGVIIIAMVSGLSRDLRPAYDSIQACTDDPESTNQPRDYTVSLLAIMSLLVVLVCIFIVFLDTPYKRQEAERSTTNRTTNTAATTTTTTSINQTSDKGSSSSLSSSSSTSNQSLTATSGYGSEHTNATNSSKRSGRKKRGTILEEEEDGGVFTVEPEDKPEVLQSHL